MPDTDRIIRYFGRTRMWQQLSDDFLKHIQDRYHYNHTDYESLRKTALDMRTCMKDQECYEICLSVTLSDDRDGMYPGCRNLRQFPSDALTAHSDITDRHGPGCCDLDLLRSNSMTPPSSVTDLPGPGCCDLDLLRSNSMTPPSSVTDLPGPGCCDLDLLRSNSMTPPSSVTDLPGPGCCDLDLLRSNSMTPHSSVLERPASGCSDPEQLRFSASYADIAITLGYGLDQLMEKYIQTEDVLRQCIVEHISAELLRLSYEQVHQYLLEQTGLAVLKLHFWGEDSLYPLESMPEIAKELTRIQLRVTNDYCLEPSKSVLYRVLLERNHHSSHTTGLLCEQCPRRKLGLCEFSN